MYTFPKELLCELISADDAVCQLEEYTLNHSDFFREINTASVKE